MKHLIVLIIAILIPAAAVAKNECDADREKFCKAVEDAKGDLRACMTQHMAELSEACRAKVEARRAKEQAPAKKSD
jgi:hypothetical protein